MQYVIGIDGGGSKLELCVADIAGTVVQTVRIDRACNPWNAGLQQLLDVLDEALAQVEAYKSEVVCIAAGIAGMLEVSKFHAPVRQALEAFCPHVVLTGDLPISFRAISDAEKGIIAIAGTGSSILLLLEDGTHKVWDGVGASGRELGLALARACQRGTIGTAGTAFIRSKILALDDLQTSHDIYHHPDVAGLCHHVALLNEQSPEFLDVQPIVDTAVDRWRYKLYGFSKLYRQLEPDHGQLEIVLNGGLWNFDYIRQHVVDPLSAEFPESKFLFDPALPPVRGAVKLALDALHTK